MSYWQGKVAVVTGGTSGLGRVLAETFAAAGASVMIAARRQDDLDRAVEEMSGEGRTVAGVAADVTEASSAERLIEQTVERFSRLDVLVNCAGRSTRSHVLETTPELFREIWEVNFLGTVHCSRAAAEHLIPAKGHLVNIGSLSAKTASPFMSAYVASKFAVAAYSQQLRLELGPRGLHVLLVCPGPILRDDGGIRYQEEATDLPEKAHQPGAGARLKGLSPEKVARAVLRGCEKRKVELVMPNWTRALFVLSAISPRLGDWIVRKMT